jgi:Uma2 family endonuclease
MSPDVSWIKKSRLVGVEMIGFIPIVPDFVIELRSATDCDAGIFVEYESGLVMGFVQVGYKQVCCK